MTELDSKALEAAIASLYGAVSRRDATSAITAYLSALPAAEARGVAIGLERAALSAGAHDVLAERERQVSVEGWAPAHDDEHWNGGLAWAASCYCVAQWANVSPPVATFIKHAWPWDKKWWKPTDRRRNLVKAGALIIAELDRLDRADAIRSLSPAHK